jgi:HlyD family secretion protein
VHHIEPAGFTRISALGVEEQRVNVIVDLDAPREAWEGLGDGYRIEARIRIWAAPDVLTVPANATFRSGDGWAVFRVEAGRARMRPVTVGQRTAARVELTEGLAEGDTVISYPGEKVSDGVRVVARDAR